MEIVWNAEKMATGVPEVDAQHQEWIRRFNDFGNALNHGKGHQSVQAALDFFVTYAETHFALEEARMEERNCPAARINKEDHDRIRAILAGYKKYTSQHGFSMSEVASLRKIMEDWLVKHIMTIDIQLRDC